MTQRREPPADAPRPLAGIRVLDFTWARAGPWCTRFLALLGADVVKVEWPDPALGGHTGRAGHPPGYSTTPPGVAPGPNSTGYFSDSNAGKRSVTVNVRTELGTQLIRELLARSDVVVENFSAGVLKGWGIGYEEMTKLRPDVVYLSMAGFGHTGPLAHYQTIGPSVQAISGLTQLSGLPDAPPAGWGWSYMDDTGGYYGVIGVLTALHYRNVTGKGQHVDLSQVAAGIPLVGPALLDASVNGRGSRREGFPPGNRAVWPGAPVRNNYRGRVAVPHNAYRTAPGGYNDWVAIVCERDAEWRALVELLGRPGWAIDPALHSLAGRIAQQEAIDRGIEAWTSTLDKYEVAARCQAAGIAALPVQSSEDRVSHDPQLREWGLYEPRPHAVLGTFPIQGSPFRLSGAPTSVTRAGPLAGEHNVEVLCELLGLPREELRAGYEDGTFWPRAVPLQPYLLEALAEAAS